MVHETIQNNLNNFLAIAGTVSDSMVAVKFQVTVMDVIRARNSLGIPSYNSKITAHKLQIMSDKGMTISDIAQKTNLHISTIEERCDYFGITIPRGRYRSSRKPKKHGKRKQINLANHVRDWAAFVNIRNPVLLCNSPHKRSRSLGNSLGTIRSMFVNNAARGVPKKDQPTFSAGVRSVIPSKTFENMLNIWASDHHQLHGLYPDALIPYLKELETIKKQPIVEAQINMLVNELAENAKRVGLDPSTQEHLIDFKSRPILTRKVFYTKEFYESVPHHHPNPKRDIGGRNSILRFIKCRLKNQHRIKKYAMVSCWH